MVTIPSPTRVSEPMPSPVPSSVSMATPVAGVIAKLTNSPVAFVVAARGTIIADRAGGRKGERDDLRGGTGCPHGDHLRDGRGWGVGRTAHLRGGDDRRAGGFQDELARICARANACHRLIRTGITHGQAGVCHSGEGYFIAHYAGTRQHESDGLRLTADRLHHDGLRDGYGRRIHRIAHLRGGDGRRAFGLQDQLAGIHAHANAGHRLIGAGEGHFQTRFCRGVEGYFIAHYAGTRQHERDGLRLIAGRLHPDGLHCRSRRVGIIAALRGRDGCRACGFQDELARIRACAQWRPLPHRNWRRSLPDWRLRWR